MKSHLAEYFFLYWGKNGKKRIVRQNVFFFFDEEIVNDLNAEYNMNVF